MMPAGRSVAIVGIAAVLASACSTAPRKASPPTAQPLPSSGQTTPPARRGPVDFNSIPDAVPKFEPRSKRGNPPFYEVLGRRYVVLSSAQGYLERGVASWYGPGFDMQATSIGDAYDMYGMSAAHKTLPLPCYARVTNLANGKSVIVRVNDRGPFVANRLIDLSYTAAAKLDMLRQGTALVEVRVLTPGQTDSLTRASETPPPIMYVQAGAFAEQDNAKRLLARMQRGGITNVLIVPPIAGKGSLYRVRVGPVASVADFDQIAARLSSIGIADARLAID